MFPFRTPEEQAAASAQLNDVWRLPQTLAASIRTGGFCTTLFAVLRCPPGFLDEQASDPAFAGYCLDAPDSILAGSTVCTHGNVQATFHPR